ncbi:MAG: DNA polymerase I, partial [Anaerolineae bacterium]|nr:DNA polymerase I [Anaerolineae bacterium]
LAFDTETTSTDPMRAELVGISLAVREGEAFHIPVGHQTGERQLELELVLNGLRPAMTDPGLPKIGQNLKYDVLVLSNHGLVVAGCAFDTMIAQWIIDPASRNLGLKGMAEDYLNLQMSHIEELIGSGKNQRSMAQVAIQDCANYAGADAEVTLRLKPLLEEGMRAHDALKIFEEIEMPLVTILADMEKAGIMLDLPFFKSMETWLAERMAVIEKSIFQDIGREFNINSTQQLSKALFETLKLEPPDRRQRTASGHFSTSASNLEDIRDQHPVIDKILEQREYAKIKSTYVDALPLQVNPRTGRVHTSFNQTGVVTGRISSSDPNLQNIPTRTEVGRQVRKGFIAAPGNLLLAVDYSQIELRIVAHLSHDEAMLNAFRAGQDIHSATAAAIYRIPLTQVTKEQRRHAKTINFGLIYGMSAFGLSRGTDLTLGEAEDFVRAYFEQFPGVKRYLAETRKEAAEKGFVETMLGRRRYFPNLKGNANVNQRNREEREAINAPIQGTAADIIKLAMLDIPGALAREGLQSRMLLQVHDELVLECPEAEIKNSVAVVRSVMEQAYTLSIPLLTEARVGRNWGELEIYPG